MATLFERLIAASDPLSKFRNTSGEITACIYPEPYDGCADVVRWFYSRNNSCQVFYACSQDISDKIDADSWADVSYEFTVFVEHELMPYCVETTDWDKCSKYGIEYDEQTSDGQFGCMGSSCHCEPFGQGDFTYGIAEENEFTF